MDKVLKVQHLSVLDLLDPEEVNKRASILPPPTDDFQNILLVEGTTCRHRSRCHEHGRQGNPEIQEELSP